MTSVLRLIALVFTLIAPAYAQQQENTQEPEQNQQQENDQQSDQENSEPLPDIDNQPIQAGSGGPGRFIPSEQISQDSGVSFPVDI